MIDINTEKHTYITSNKVQAAVRGGGLGGNAYVAKITGTHPRFGLAREFLRADESGRSNSGKSGLRCWYLPGDGLYEARRLPVTTRKTVDVYFVVEGDEVREVTLDEAKKIVGSE